MGGSYTTRADIAKKSKIATDQEIGDSKYAIIHPEGKGAEVLGHEVGHVDNMEAGKKWWDIPGKIRKAISKKANDPKVRGEMQLSVSFHDNDGAVGFKEGAKRFFQKKSGRYRRSQCIKKVNKIIKEEGCR